MIFFSLSLLPFFLFSFYFLLLDFFVFLQPSPPTLPLHVQGVVFFFCSFFFFIFSSSVRALPESKDSRLA